MIDDQVFCIISWQPKSVRVVSHGEPLEDGFISPQAEGVVAWLGSLARLSRSISEEIPPADFFSIASQLAVDLPGVTACAIQMATRSSTHLVIKGSTGLSQEYVDSIVESRVISLAPDSRYFESPSSRSYRLGKIMCVDDTEADPSYAPWRVLARKEGYRSLVTIPILDDKKPMGVLALYSAETGFADDDRLRLFLVLNEHITGALRLVTLRRKEGQTLRRLAAANKTLQQQQEILDRAHDQHQELMQLVFEGAGCNAIATWAAEFFECPIVIEDDSGALVASALPPGHEDEDLPISVDAELVEECLPTRNGVQHVSLGATGAWVAPIFVDGKASARLWALDRAKPADPLERRLLERATLVVSVELWRERYERELDARFMGTLMDEVMSGEHFDSDALRRKAQHLGIDLESDHVFVLMTPLPDARDESLPTFDGRKVAQVAIEAALSQRGNRFITSWSGDALEVLLQVNTGYDRTALTTQIESIARDASRSLNGRSLLSVVADTSREPGDYPAARRSAYSILGLASRSRSQVSRVIDIPSLGVTALLVNASRPADLLAFRDSCLKPLKDHDRKRDSGLLETLRVHLQTGGSNQATAQHLYLHPNTVLYRLNNIEKLCGMDLRSTEALLRMQLAVLIDDLAGDD